MIRKLQSHEVALCVEGGKSFFDEGKLPGGFEPDTFTQTWERMIGSGMGCIHGSFNGDTITGAIGAVLCPNLNSGKLMAVECFWFVFPQYRGHGLKLLLAYEQWAKDSGARLLSMIHLNDLQPEKLKHLYERMGYRAVETNYLKEVA